MPIRFPKHCKTRAQRSEHARRKIIGPEWEFPVGKKLAGMRYPQDSWTWHPIESTKNMQRYKGTVRCDSHWKGTVSKATEWVLIKKKK